MACKPYFSWASGNDNGFYEGVNDTKDGRAAEWTVCLKSIVREIAI